VDINKLQEPLTVDELNFRVQSINNGGYATILPYKDARVDINRLNSACGVFGWQKKYSRENKNCTVSLWHKESDQWVSKEDTGTESGTEAEKGLASDSFKRACFNWGIGIELYDYPVIQLKLTDDEVSMVNGQKPKATWKFKLKEWKWYLKTSTKGKVEQLAAQDQLGNTRFNYTVKVKK